MNTANHLSSGSEQISQTLETINQLCDQLINTFTPTREQVSTTASEFSSSLSHQDYLITDETLRKINTLDRHLGQLYAIATEEQLLTDHHELWTTIQDKIDLIVQSLLSDHYFHMTYGWRMGEIIDKLQTMQYERSIAA